MSSYSGTAAKTAKDVILTDPSTYYQWYENIKGSVPDQFWEYFDPESDADPEEIKPVKPIKPVNTRPPVAETSGPSTRNSRAPTETPEQQATRESKFQKELDRYYQDFNVYKEDARQWEKYMDCKTKLRDRILSTVSQQKSARLVTSNPLREWLAGLRDSTRPPKTTVKQTIRVEYGKLTREGQTDWPAGGPSSWIAKWEDLIYRAEQYSEPLPNWLADVSLVWQKVPDLTGYFDTVETNMQEEATEKYTYASVAAAIEQRWERKKQGTIIRYSKPKATRSAFTAATFDGEEPPQDENATEGQDSIIGKKKSKKSKERRNTRKDRSRSRSPAPEDHTAAKSDKRDKTLGTFPCTACGGTTHSFMRCYLVQGKDKDWISEEARETFRNNMKAASFKEEVDKVRRRKRDE